eukprot:TRINITY_DN1220_c0_g1_i7.p1 TRINITY_DN1220_c0_g1~~TRINITY_DN1220_c0_g1_i7.p1  ORF type:complete len:211 (+),score=44.70 TRINITY_DN1220_c0_g1_i7:1060-1692(+)
MQAASKIFLAGSHPTINDVYMTVKGYAETNNAAALRYAVFNDKNMHLRLPFPNFIDHKETMTLAASTTYTSTMKTVKGTIIGLFVSLRAASVTAANQATYVPIASLDIQLAGKSLLGGYIRTHDDLKLEMAELLNNSFALNKDCYFISFSSDPAGDYGSGNVSGYQAFTGEDQLVFTTTAALSAGAYVLDVAAVSAEHLLIDKGVVEASK